MYPSGGYRPLGKRLGFTQSMYVAEICFDRRDEPFLARLNCERVHPRQP
jgi:hypothetical protein